MGKIKIRRDVVFVDPARTRTGRQINVKKGTKNYSKSMAGVGPGPLPPPPNSPNDMSPKIPKNVVCLKSTGDPITASLCRVQFFIRFSLHAPD